MRRKPPTPARPTSARRDFILRRLSSAAAPVSAKYLALELGVSSRTIERDIVILRRAGHDLKAVPGRTGGIVYHDRRSTLPIATGDDRVRPVRKSSTPAILPAETSPEILLAEAERHASTGEFATAVRTLRHLVDDRLHELNSDAAIRVKGRLAQALGASAPRSMMSGAVGLLREAIEEAIQVGELNLAVGLAETDIQPISADSPHSTELADLLLKVLALPDLSPIQRGILLGLYSHAVLTERNELASSKAAAIEAEEIAETTGDTVVRMRSQQAWLGIEFKTGDMQRAIERASEVLRFAQGLANAEVELRSRFQLIMSLKTLGRLKEATVHAQAMLSRAQQLHRASAVEQATGVLSSLELMTGRLGAALERAGHARSRFATTSSSLLPTALVSVYDATGSGLDYAYDFTDSAVSSRWLVPLETSILALSIGLSEPTAAQIHGLRGLIESFDQSGGATAGIALRLGLEPLVDALEGRTQRALVRLAGMEPRQSMLIGTAGVPVASLMGATALRSGQPEMAAGYFKNGARICRRTGSLPQLACALVNEVAAQITSASGAYTDTRIVEAGQIAQRLGLVAVLRRLHNLNEPERDDRAVHNGRLTDREREVVLLIAAGMTTREIADSLLITESTVNRHTTNILSAIGARNRVEAAAYAFRNGLVG